MAFATATRGLRLALLVALGTAVAGCGLPRSGPTKGEVLDSSKESRGSTQVVMATQGVARAADYAPALGFSSAFRSAGVVGSDTISAGDTLGLTIWENVDQGILSASGAPTPLNTVQVDGDGYIFVPYAGRMRAAGLTPEQLRVDITDSLQAQTPDPQVMVVRQAGDGSTVSVAGSVGAQGVYPIERPTRTLSSMLAQAGGLTIESDIAQVTVLRGNQRGTIWFNSLFEAPQNDIALRGGDRILVEGDRRAYTALGATGSQTRINFNSQELTAMEALAQVGGLQTNAADPTGIFILRTEPEEVARVVTGNPALYGPQQVVYVLNLTSGEGLFVAKQFTIRNDDTLYVTEAPWTQFNKALATFFGSLNTVASSQQIAGNI
ncbi:polysaccharide biosynthesis/export family protein [Poseidonocella sp. HB161398]|uniref:polysaccharide biosynthesis/export family protein n=1 Tax=Poseidonocella sp. HB161398 TaxID=2320855 RepID=UPI0011092298|nr:polysaccharide biosynthesis/export family protein [Poseidonocella sp. HB161398]